MAKRKSSPPTPDTPFLTLTAVRVQAYKSIVDSEVTIRPLTLLAGSNSSGKSSILQPLLLLKQTQEVPYETGGVLALDGPHVQITSSEQIVSALLTPKSSTFSITVNTYQDESYQGSTKLTYQKANEGFFIKYLVSQTPRDKTEISPLSTWNAIRKHFPDVVQEQFAKRVSDIQIEPTGFSLDVVGYNTAGTKEIIIIMTHETKNILSNLIHIPGLRGNPKRAYPLASFKYGNIRGTFEPYTAGIIQRWQTDSDTASLTALTDALIQLGLTRAVSAKTINANEIEVKVGRLPVASKAKREEMVNIADVGFGVSQVLPIVVALIAAEPGQVVYIEQPELHLHPRAQVEMAKLLAKAAKRGVRVIVETHSSLLLLTIQTLVAEHELTPEEVALHWFERDAKGATKVTLAELDEKGTYGPWPEDFGDVELRAQADYLDAVTRQNPSAQ